MPLAFPWERSNRPAIRHPLSNSSHSASIRSVLNEQKFLRSRGTSTATLQAPRYHVNLPDLPEVARRKEAELNGLLGECFDLYDGQKHINSYENSDFYNSSNGPLKESPLPSPDPVPSSCESRSIRQGFVLPRPPERSPSQTVSPYSRLQYTLDHLIPAASQRAREGSPSLPVLPENTVAGSSPPRGPSLRSVSESPQSPVTPRRLGRLSPYRNSAKKTPVSGTQARLSRNISSPLHKRSGLLKLPFLRNPTPFNLSASPIFSLSPTRDQRRCERTGSGILSPPASPSSPNKLVKQRPAWRASPIPESKHIETDLRLQDLEETLPHIPSRSASSAWSSQVSFSTISPSTKPVASHIQFDEEMGTSTRKKGKRVEKAPPAKSISVTTKRKDPYIDNTKLYSRNSKLISRRLHGLFAHPEALTCLNAEERDCLASLLSSNAATSGHDKKPPSDLFLKHDNNWRTAVREFQEDLESGRYESQWLSDAIDANASRKEGAYDSWKDENFEEFWGQKATAPFFAKQTVTESSELMQMAKHGAFSVGDAWTYSRLINRSGQSESILVEKELRISQIDESGKIHFSIPPSQQKAFNHPLPRLPRKPLPSPRPRSAASGRTRSPSPTRKSEIVRSPSQSHNGLEPAKDLQPSQTISIPDSDADDDPILILQSPPRPRKRSKTPLGSQSRAPSPSAASEGGMFVLKDAVQVLVSCPEELEQKVLETDGRATETSHTSQGSNSWKLFRCRHENKDIGTLWDLRQKILYSKK